MRQIAALSIFFSLLAACRTAAPQPQETLPSQSGPYTDRVAVLLQHPRVKTAFAHVEEHLESSVKEWAELTEINAPSGHEADRAARVETLLRELQLEDIRRDSAGNLIATRPGMGGGPTVVVDAHLDTVFQPGQVIKATIREGKIYAPGVGDDTRNIEAMFASIRALNAAGIQTRGDLIFLFTVEEETNFKGVNQFLADNKDKVDHFLALDGGYAGFTYGGLGIYWYKHHFIGPGGHTRSSTPPYSGTLPVARAITRIMQLKLPDEPPTHLNIGMLGGADVVNAKAADAWFTVDLRSTSNEVIADFERRIAAILAEEARRTDMTVRTELISSESAAQLPGHRFSPLILTAEAIHVALGFENPPIVPTASNHASAALRAGISALSTGTALCGDAHALSEYCEIGTFARGIQKLIALELAMAGIVEEDS